MFELWSLLCCQLCASFFLHMSVAATLSNDKFALSVAVSLTSMVFVGKGLTYMVSCYAAGSIATTFAAMAK